MNKDVIAMKHPRAAGKVVLVGIPGFMDKITPFHPNIYTDAGGRGEVKDACIIDKDVYEKLRLGCIQGGVASASHTVCNGLGIPADAAPAPPPLSLPPQGESESESQWKDALEDVKATLKSLEDTIAEVFNMLSQMRKSPPKEQLSGKHTDDNVVEGETVGVGSAIVDHMEAEGADEEELNVSPTLGW
jgi:hypothetical protein